MLRAIFRRRMRDAISGCEVTNHLFSFRVDVPSIENELRRGGFGESGYEIVELLGVEIEHDKKVQQCCGTCAFWSSSNGAEFGRCTAPVPEWVTREGDSMSKSDGTECTLWRE